jgi:rhodanese-related sulfurtransferase/DNA-binding MarR family transcriptional regulator
MPSVRSVDLDNEIAKLGQVFANPLRVRILELLTQGERSVDEIRERLSVPLTTVSSQLTVLKQARLVDTRREAQRIHYRLADESVVAALLALRELAQERSLEAQQLVREFLEDTKNLEQIDSDRLYARLRKGDTVLIDVRPRDEFESGHIPGAISLPVDEIEARVSELPRNARVVAYCRDAYCVLAPSAVRAIRKFGVAGERLDIGYAEWLAKGRPIEIAQEEQKESAA